MQTGFDFTVPPVDPRDHPVQAPHAPHFDGVTYEPSRDHARLTGQLGRVFEALKDGRWKTLGELESLTGAPQASIGARLRDLRKSRFGGFEVQHRVRQGHAGLWEYRLVL